MKKTRLFAMTAAAVALAAVIISGCSGKGDAQRGNNTGNDFADSVTAALINEIEQAQLARAEAVATGHFPDGAVVGEDMVIADSLLYAVSGHDFVIYNLAAKSEQRVPAAEQLYAVAIHDGRVFVGGESLWEYAGGALEVVPAEFDGTITSLYSYEYRLMIGTTEGLYAKSIFGDETLFDGIFVSAMAADNDGLWVGTGGQGLYRWNGADFTRRFLLRDTMVFDNVNALAYNHGHLYVGTDDALYVYDGGRWETMTTEHGLPSNVIHSIDASNWVVYVGTSAGVASWFDYRIEPVAKLADINALAVRVYGNRLIAATDSRGLLLKSGPVVTTLIVPDTDRVETADVPAEPVAAATE